MQKSREGMGIHKHGVSGKVGPSPKTKFMRALDANRLADDERKKRRKPSVYRSISDLMEHEKSR